MNLIYQGHDHRLTTFMQPLLSPANLLSCAEVIHRAGVPLENCWGFVDRTVRPICRPGRQHRILYNGHKRIHSIKFQSVVTPNGLIANLLGHYEGKKHDSGMLAESGLLTKLGKLQLFPYR